MDDKPNLEWADQAASQLTPQDQLKLVALISDRLSGLLLTEGPMRANLPELQRMEAEWVSQELAEFVRLIQRYRALYVTAMFLSVGWVLGQAVGTSGYASNVPTGATPWQEQIKGLQLRPDIAAVLCIVPLLNVFFAALMLEAFAQMKTLARYRFILGFDLGGGQPPWRWERWKETHEGSIHYWTNPLNAFSLLILLIITASSLSFPFPAVWNSSSWVLWALWSFALLSVIGIIVVIFVVGYRYRHRNAVAAPPSLRWSDLWPPPNEVSNKQR